jgi:hypothetical protein
LRGCGVVRDDQRLLAYADASHRLLENLELWEGVTAAGPSRSGQISLKIHPNCPGNVPRREVRPAGRSAQRPADVCQDLSLS